MKKSLIVLFISVVSVYSQYPTFRIFPSNVQQIEPSIARHPINPSILFASAFTIAPGSVVSEGVYISTNGGVNWTGTDVIHASGDAGDPGPIIDKNGVFILAHQGSFQAGMYSNFSTNNGSTWSNTIQIASGIQEKGSPATDDITSSPYYGRSYLAWTRYQGTFPIVISYTTNSGTSWVSFITVNSTFNGNRSFGPSMATGNNGTIYVCWASTIPVSPFTEDAVGFASSTNGGDNWNATEFAYDCNGIKTSALSPWSMRANGYPLMDVDKSGGPRNGWIYIVTAEKNLAPAGSDPDVVFHRSTNGGQTWSPGKRVNQDVLNNGKIQFFPIIRVDEDGGLNVIYYDNRNSTDSVDVYLSRSIDGGDTWNDFRVSNHRFRPKPAAGSPGGNMGDNIGITSGNGKLYPVWTSNKTADSTFQVWTAIIDYATIGINKINTEIPKSFALDQNYPNPFNPVTKIRFAISEASGVKLIVYDETGKELKTLVDEQMKPGNYETEFEANSLASGIYFYRLTAGNFSQSKKMMLIK